MKNISKKITIILLAICLVSVIGFKVLAQDDIMEVSSYENLVEAFKTGGNIKLTSDITPSNTENTIETLVVEDGVEVTLDLNGKLLETDEKQTGRHYYAVDNYGTFNLKDSSIGKTGTIRARGIENYGGTIIVDGGTIVSVDSNGGAAVWNDNISDETYYFDIAEFDLDNESDKASYDSLLSEDGVAIVDIENDDAYYNLYGYVNLNKKYKVYFKDAIISQGKLYINNGSFKTEYIGSTSDASGPGCINNQNGAYTEIHGGDFYSVNKRTYSIISNGEIKIDESNAKVNVFGTHGALGINKGKAIVDGGSYESTEFYGIWITNNGNISDVTINGGTFIGATYGLRASVDDGKQDMSDVSIVINDGTFIGKSKKAAAAIVNNSTENEWAMIINGGKFNTDVNAYVTNERYFEYDLGEGEEIRYLVAPKNIDLATDDEYIVKVGDELKTNIRFIDKYDNSQISNSLITPIYSLSNDNVTLTKDIIKGLKKGKTTLTIELFEGKLDKVYEIPISVYDIKGVKLDTKDEITSESLTNDSKDIVNETFVEVISSVLNDNEKIVGVSETLKTAIKEELIAGKDISTKLITDNIDKKAVKDDIKAIEQLASKSKIANYYDISIKVFADSIEIGKISELKEEITITLPIPENLPDLKKGYERIYTIIRYHDNKAEELKTTDNSDGTISFNSKLYSTYALTFIDKKVENDSNNLDDVPKTGDISIIEYILGLFNL